MTTIRSLTTPRRPATRASLPTDTFRQQRPWRRVARLAAWADFLVPLVCACSLGAGDLGGKITSTWPAAYTVERDEAAGRLTLSTPYYSVQHDLHQGGAISRIRLTHGRAANLLVQPIGTRLEDESGVVWTDLKDALARVSHRQDGLNEIVTVECQLKDDHERASGVTVKTVFEYRWGYLKIRREFTRPADLIRVREVCPIFTVLTPSLSDYGYREGITEQEGAPPFAFGSNRWGKLRLDHPSDRPVTTAYAPRSLLFADAGVEGLEWFVGSDLWQWDSQLAERRGQGRFLLEPNLSPPGLALSLAPFASTNSSVVLPKTCRFDFYIGLPLVEGHALRPWLHTSFNRNRGDWVSPEQIRRWAVHGIQTVHCHNDGDYYEDGLFWRDGSYPPYPDMARYDAVIADCHRAGIRVATYFSNKELHPSTKEFQEHDLDWGRMDRQGKLQHNFFRGTNEFGAQMCLRSGWLEFLKFSIDRVLDNHPLDGVYYDWNVALFCCNGRHEAKPAGVAAAGHWDIDELLELMEWTRRRVGPRGLIIVHNTTTPMFATENFADYVVANEWGYGTWKDQAPSLEELPLEWSLVGARPRGVISYGQLNAQSPRRLHRAFALEALLSGVTPWPASPETFELFSILKPLGDIEAYRFADWRNHAVDLEGTRCASAIYSRTTESYILLGNLENRDQPVHCVLHPERLPCPLASPVAATLIPGTAASDGEVQTPDPVQLDIRQLTGTGVNLTVPADGAVLVHIH